MNHISGNHDAAVVTLTVLSGTAPPPRDVSLVAVWDAFLTAGHPDTWRSIPHEIQKNRDTLRHRYLEWVHSIGSTHLKNSTLRERTRIRPTLSYWWMTVPAAYSLDAQSPVYDAVRLMELARIVDETQADTIDVRIDLPSERKMVTAWARSTGRRVVKNPSKLGPKLAIPSSRFNRIKAALSSALPPLAAANVLFSLPKSPRSRTAGHVEDLKSAVIVVDYLAHLGPSSVAGGRFESNYWGPVVDLVDELAATTWLHLPADQPTRRSVKRDTNLVRSWKVAPGVRHRLLHECASPLVKMRALRDYLRVVRLGLGLRCKRKLFLHPDAQGTLWPAFSKAFRSEWYGKAAMLNCLYINSFEEFFAKQPTSLLGLYLFENQPWEMALIHAWRQAGHGRLIGVAHSTIRYWDTRIFKDERDLWACSTPGGMLWPDQITVCGPAMRSELTSGHYPEARLIDVESVRFTPPLERAATPVREGRWLLVLGEYSWPVTARILEIVRGALANQTEAFRVRFRPHPASLPQWTRQPPWLEMDGHGRVSAAIRASDLILCGAVSSAAIDALLQGRETFLIADGTTFLSSPAEGLGATWIFTPEDLQHTLLTATRPTQLGDPLDSNIASAFKFDVNLQRWAQILDVRNS